MLTALLHAETFQFSPQF